MMKFEQWISQMSYRMCTVIAIRWTNSSNIFSLNGHNSWMIEMRMKRRVPQEGKNWKIGYEGIRCYWLDCRHDASIYKQTCTNIKVLQNSLDSRSINNDIRHHLIKIVRYVNSCVYELVTVFRHYLMYSNNSFGVADCWSSIVITSRQTMPTWKWRLAMLLGL